MFLLGFVFSYKEFQIMINPPRILAEVNRSKRKIVIKIFATFDLKDKTGRRVKTSSEPETVSVTNFMDNLSLDRAKVLPRSLG